MSNRRSGKSTGGWYNDPNQKDDLYTGVAQFGRITAIIGAIVATIAGLIMFGFGVHILVSKSDKVKTSAKVVTASCDQWTQNQQSDNSFSSRVMYNCDLDIQYLVDGKWVNGKLHINSERHYKNGDNFSIYYHKNNPDSIDISGPTPHALGWVLVVMGILFVAGSWLWVWLTHRYKLAAAVQGTESGIEMLGLGNRGGGVGGMGGLINVRL